MNFNSIKTGWTKKEEHNLWVMITPENKEKDFKTFADITNRRVEDVASKWYEIQKQLKVNPEEYILSGTTPKRGNPALGVSWKPEELELVHKINKNHLKQECQELSKKIDRSYDAIVSKYRYEQRKFRKNQSKNVVVLPLNEKKERESWSKADEELLKNYYHERKPYKDIANEMGRSYSSVTSKLDRMKQEGKLDLVSFEIEKEFEVKVAAKSKEVPKKEETINQEKELVIPIKSIYIKNNELHIVL